MLIEISDSLIDPVKKQAQKSPRKRINYNFHQSMDDPINRMLHVMNKGTYVQPHKHENPDKREVFLLFEGRVAIFEFNDDGLIMRHIILDRETRTYGVEVPVGTWHALVALEDNSVVYELKDGPYEPASDKNFASWAPSENDPESMQNEYLIKLTDSLGK